MPFELPILMIGISMMQMCNYKVITNKAFYKPVG
jgi:hypothetical protein